MHLHPAQLRRITSLGSLAFALLGFLSGCATAGRIFSPEGYRIEASAFREAAERGEGTALRMAQMAAKKAKGHDTTLFVLEEARLRSLAGDSTESIRLYQQATDLFEIERQKPVFRATEAFFSAAAIATNDRFLPYESSGFERVMAHNALALEFLREHQADRAQIALNGAIVEMDYQRERIRALADRSKEKTRQTSLPPGSTESAIATVQRQLETASLPGLASYQSAFTFYLASALFELQGDGNRAEIAMRRAGQLYPQHPSIIDAIAHGWREQPNDALVVAIVTDGWVPLRETIALPLVWNRTILQIVMPFYNHDSGRWGSSETALRIDGQASLHPTVITDIGAQVRQNLADEYPAIFLRQALRLIAKYQMQNKLEQENPLAGFAAQVVNLLTDQADLRSWSTLPGTLQVAHTSLRAGKHRFSWGQPSGTTPLEIDLPPGSTLFLMIEQTGAMNRQNAILLEPKTKPSAQNPTLQP